MKYIIYGGSGFLGSKITEKLLEEGEEIIVADIREPRNKNTKIKFLKINLLETIPEDSLLENPDVVINLAGKLIFGKWNQEFKDLIYNTRVLGTKNIIDSFSKDEKYKPKYLVNASAVGIYGNHGEEEIDENSSFGNSFLSNVAKDWEEEALKAKGIGVKVRILRNAHILGKAGLIGTVLPIYKWGVGGPLGNGKQWMPWIHVDDVANLYIESAKEDFPEIVNAVAPQFIRDKEFSKEIARTLKRPHLFFIPRFALKILYGEFADEMLISQKLKSSKLKPEDIKFKKIEEALKDIIYSEK